ncbi:MAG: DUF4350 domain-containing protein [Pseudomonadota bacterium]
MSANLAAPGVARERGSSPFSRASVLAIVVVGFTAFAAMLYFLSAGNTGPRDSSSGAAHALSNSLNGYSALARLVEADGYEVERSRNKSKLTTTGLLVLTPPRFSSSDELSEIIEDRRYRGPTLLIMPKWMAVTINEQIKVENPDEVKEDWVLVGDPSPPFWADEITGSEVERSKAEELDYGKTRQWTSKSLPVQLSGDLPDRRVVFAQPAENLLPIIVDDRSRALAVNRIDLGNEYVAEEFDGEEELNWVVIVTEPDLMNNSGLADETRALAALSLVREMGYGDHTLVVFDLTLNGFGGATNLLTLAFQPPFLAATLCLLLAVAIIGWRAFRRFGPAIVKAPAAQFGKSRLVTNGADLIVRAGRFGLLAEPYTNLTARRLARALGLAKFDAETLDAAIAQRLPDEASFSERARAMEQASKPTDIMRAARALSELTGKITQ